MAKLGATSVSRTSEPIDTIALMLISKLGHCYLMTENLQKAYDAYQQALVNLRDAKVRYMMLLCAT